MFNPNIPTFKYSDLDGKTLEIRVAEGVDGKVVVGVEKTTGKIYVLVNDAVRDPGKPNVPLLRDMFSKQ